MKKNPLCLTALAVGLCAVLIAVLALGRAILGRNTELVCDACGTSFIAAGDYSSAVAEDAELEALYGIDMYGFYCPDCIDPRMQGPLVSFGSPGESIEELEKKLQPYLERKAAAKKEEQNALFRTAVIFLAISGCAVGLFSIGRKKVND